MAKKKPTATRSWWNSPSIVFEIGLVLLALVLRLIYLSQVRDNPFFTSPTMDPAYHLQWAKEILSGNLWGAEAYFRAPLYPYMLAVFLKITGGDLFWVRFLQHLIGVASIWGIYRLTRTVFSEGAAKIAGLAAASYATMIYFENELLLDWLLIAWILLIIYAVHRTQQTGLLRWVFAVGVAVGLFAITRPNILLCLPVIAIWVWRMAPNKASISMRAKRLLLILAGTALPILPVTIHNATVGNDFVLISSQGGINFYIGNHAGADGLSASMPEPWGHTWKMTEVQAYAEKQVGAELKPSGVSSFWLGQALDWWSENTGEAINLTFKKAILLFTNTEVANNQDIEFFWKQYAPLGHLLPLSYGVVVSFGLIGLLAAAKREPLIKLMLWIMLFYAISVVAFFVPGRYRLPFLPFLFAGFGGFVVLVYQQFKEKVSGRKIAVTIVPAILVLILSFGRWYSVESATDAQSIFQLGNNALREGRLDDATARFRETLAMEPGYEGAHLNLGVVYLKKGLLTQAEAEFFAELKGYPESGKAYANLCTIRGLQNRTADAEEFGRRALQLEPDNPTALVNLAKSYWSRRKFKEAVDLLEPAPDFVKESPVGRIALGGSYLQMERLDKAEEILGPLADGTVSFDLAKYGIDAKAYAEELGYNNLQDNQARANYNLGWLHALDEDTEGSMAYFRKAIELKPEFHQAYANLGSAFIGLGMPDSALAYFRVAINAQPKNPSYIYNVGIAVLNQGDTLSAIEHFQQALNINRRFTPAKRKLQELPQTGIPVIKGVPIEDDPK